MSANVGESTSAGSSGDAAGGSFECNICFELPQEPIVTLCGHLFCWPCLYRWLHVHAHSPECPVCKALVEEDKLVPLYGRGKDRVDPRSKNMPEADIPHRPTGQRPPPAPQADANNNNNNFANANANPWFMGAGVPLANARWGNYAFSAAFGGLFPMLSFQVHGFPDAAAYAQPAGFHYGFGHGHGFHGAHMGHAHSIHRQAPLGQKRQESGEEVLQARHSKRVNDVRRHHDAEDHNPRRKDEYSRDAKLDVERSHLPPRGREDVHQPYANRDRGDTRGRSYDRVRDAEMWPRREDSVHSRRTKEEDMRLEYNAEVGARHRNKARPIDRNDRDEDLHPRKRLDDGDWRGTRQRERGDMILNRHEGLDESHIKRNKDDENLRRMKPENEDTAHRTRDDHNRRKRERDDGTEQKRRDDSGRMREKIDDRHHAKQKDDSWRQREREDRQRPKHENALTVQREEGRGTGRGGRIMDDKLASGARKKDEPRSSVLSKESQERTRKNEPSRGQGAEENNMQNKGRSDVHPRESNTERNSRQEKLNNNRPSGSSDVRHAGRDRYRENTRKGRSSEPSEHDLHRSNKRRREDHDSHRSGKVETKEASERESSRSHATSKKSQNPQSDTSFMKQVEEDAMSDDENNEDSRRGRSKLERWTSNKEIEYNNVENETTEIFLPIKADVQTPANELGKSDVSATVGNSDTKGSADTGQTSDKIAEDRDRHLDTVERLKRRSERFKLPMPGEKEAPQSKKVDTEVQPPQNESAAVDMEVKPERPARKRRWTGS